VLDTWFSSGLWPFSTLGWPDQTDDLKHFYPTTLLITGFDILFFWVARMSMLGIEFMGDVPFRQVYIHGLVRDADKQKMSKTKGNVIDPLVVTEEYGTDAVRMALLTGAAPGTDIVFTVDRIATSRAFANKIWNAARFIFMNVGDDANKEYSPPVSMEDRWIWSRLNTCARDMNRAIAAYRYHEAAQTIWHFIYDDFCDWYIELKKISGDWTNILPVFDTTLRLLHPLMPFITEELWHLLRGSADKSISLQPYPKYGELPGDEFAEQEIAFLQHIVTTARNLRAELGMDPRSPLQGRVHRDVNLLAIQKLAYLTLVPGEDFAIDQPGQSEAQRRRLEKERDQLVKNIDNSERQINDKVFMSKAPEGVIQSIIRKSLDYKDQLKKIEEQLK
jgi:valyl-tRNA synthetase